MRVVLASPTLGVGGAERMVVDLARELVSTSEAVAVTGPSGPFERDLPPGVQRLVLGERSERSPAGMVLDALRMAGFLRRFRPDVVHAHNPRVAAVAAAAARLSGRRPRLVATYHGVSREDQRLAARLLGRSDVVVCVSADARDALAAAGLPPARLRVIENAVEAAPEPSPERRAALDAELGLAGRPVVAIVGRLVPQKAHHRFLEVTARMLEVVPDARVLVVGDGPLRAELEARADALRLRPDLTFTGVRDDARELIARADVLVFSSDWEGLSIAALEALAAGTPVVSTAVEGMQDLLGTGAGVTVPLDRPDAMAAAIAELLGDPRRRAAMGAAGRALAAERFSPAAMHAAYRAVYLGG